MKGTLFPVIILVLFQTIVLGQKVEFKTNFGVELSDRDTWKDLNKNTENTFNI